MRAESPAPRSIEEELTEQFYAWELRGRGWFVNGEPVRLEPPFRPFFRYLPSLPQGRDNARRPTLLSALTDWLDAKVRGRRVPEEAFEIDEPEPEPFEDDDDLCELVLTLPEGLKPTHDVSRQFLLCLAPVTGPLGFEVIGTEDAITVQMVSRSRDRAAVRSQLAAFFPEATVTEEPDHLSRLWQKSDAEGVIVDFGLSEEFMLPLKTGLDADFLVGALGALSDLWQDEAGVLQVLWEPTRAPWAESIFQAITDGGGDSFFANAPQMLPLAKQKIAQPLWAAVIRVAGRSPDPERAWDIARRLGASLSPLALPSGNELMPLTNDEYPEYWHEADFLARRSRRTGMILNSDELVSLVHLPSSAVKNPKLRRVVKKTRRAPECTSGQGTLLGDNDHGGRVREVALSPEQRTRHVHVIGASGVGKSTLLLNVILQDIEQGHGVAVLDPHGDLIDSLLARIPEERAGDVILFDPADADHPIPFNILHAHSEVEKQILASDLGAVFRRLSTSWGDQMTSVLGNAVLAFLESEQGGTLADLRRFLVEKDFREAYLRSVRDSEVVYYWQREFPLLSGRPQAPILTRLDAFLRPKVIRHIVCQPESRLDFAAIMDEGRIFLGKLAEGLIGQENAHLLGAVIVSKFQQIALARQEQEASRRRPFHLHIDEFHRFATPSLTQLLSGARKYRLGLVLAHQELRQLGTLDSETTSAVLSNPATRIAFRVGDQDARRLAEGFTHFDAGDLQNLSTGEAIAKVERAEWDFNLRTSLLPEIEPEEALQRREQIVAASRSRWAVSREVVEKALTERRAPIDERPQSPPPRESSSPPEQELSRAETPGIAEPQRDSARSQPPRPTPRPAPASSRSATPPPLGRGGPQHRYIQNSIKLWAQGMGWKATIEQPILDGAGSVDVALEREGVSVACEVSITTDAEQELGNIAKSLTANFTHVVAVAPEEKPLRKLREAAQGTFTPDQLQRVQFLTPDALFAFIETLQAQTATTEATVRGRKVRVRRKPISDEEKEAKNRAISEAMLKSLRRMRK